MKMIIGAVLAFAGMILAIIGGILKTKNAVAISVIGGADGPTSIFLAGKIGNGFTIPVMMIGVILLLLGVGIFIIKKR